MKKNLSSIFTVIMCVLFVLSMLQINSLKQEVSRLRTELDNEMYMVNENISEIYRNVQDMLEEESNQLAVSEWKYGEINIEARTAEVICTVTPKVYTPETTQANLVCNGQEWAMTYDDGQYVVKMELPLFERNEIVQVKLDDEGTIRTQQLGWVIEPRYEVLLLSYASMGGSATGTPDGEEYVWSTEYTVNIDVERKGEFEIRSVELVEVMDGKEIGRIPIDISAEGQKDYAKNFSKKGEAVPEAVTEFGKADSTNYNGYVNFIYFLDRDYHIPNGSMLELYVDVVDGNGLRYRSLGECIAITEDGEHDEPRMEEKRLYICAEPVMIFDEEGNVIYELELGMLQ